MMRPIDRKDDSAVAALIRQTLRAFHLDKPGTAYYDPQLDHLSDYYNALQRAAYFVIEEDQQVVACGGFAGLTDQVAELQKLYTHEAYRGKGYASQILSGVIEASRQAGYDSLYLETAQELAQALSLYQQFGFEALKAPLDNPAGHTAMDIWMLKDLRKSEDL